MKRDSLSDDIMLNFNCGEITEVSPKRKLNLIANSG